MRRLLLQIEPILEKTPVKAEQNDWIPFILIILGITLVGVGLILRYIYQTKEANSSNKGSDEESVDGMIRISNLHHIGRRENQQDAFGISNVLDERLCAEKGVLAVLADGMGGLHKGAEISAMITSYMLKEFPKLSNMMNTENQLLQLVMGANNKVLGYLDREGQIIGGSTVIGVIVRDSKLYFISVGDSHLYLLRRGELTLLNREHTYASELDEKVARGEISFLEAQMDPQRKALTSYIGLSELTLIDRNFRPLSLLKGDRILLMSDGVFGTLTDAEIIAAASTENIYRASQQLERAVLEKGKQGQDNFTAVILEVGGN